jgi:hypothetical protein
MKNSLYWKFCRQDGARAFSLLAELPKEDAKEIEVQVYAIRFSKSFCDWALDRIGETENGDADPMFLGAENFIVAPAKWSTCHSRRWRIFSFAIQIKESTW